MGSALVVAQVAVSLVLLVGAGLFARSLIKLQQEDLGFNRENVLLAKRRLCVWPVTRLDELSGVYRQLYDRLSALPNVRSATIASYSPMQGTSSTSTITVRGYTPNKDEDMNVGDMFVGPRFAETLGVPLLMGREIGLQDTVTSARVGVVNQTFARTYFKDQNPIGRRMTFNEDSDKEDFEIVGVIGDSKYDSAKEQAERTVFRPIMQVQDQQVFANVFELRTLGDPLSLSGSSARRDRAGKRQTSDSEHHFAATANRRSPQAGQANHATGQLLRTARTAAFVRWLVRNHGPCSGASHE